jgi:hypothetical protein
MIRIIKNEAPDLKVCDMNCDNFLHKKLEKYELSKMMNCHSTNCFIGRPKSGKTNLIHSLFENLFKKVWNKIYLFAPSNSQGSIKNNIFDNIPDERRFNELTFENLNTVMQDIKGDDKSISHCIIMDDMGAYLKNKDTLLMMKEIFMNKRHLHVSVFFMIQSFKSVEKDIRKLFDNYFIFKVSKQELEDISEEVIELPKDVLMKISKIVFNEPYKYLVYNTISGRMFSNFDEIIIDE